MRTVVKLERSCTNLISLSPILNEKKKKHLIKMLDYHNFLKKVYMTLEGPIFSSLTDNTLYTNRVVIITALSAKLLNKLKNRQLKNGQQKPKKVMGRNENVFF